MGFLILFLVFCFGAGMALLAYYGVVKMPAAMTQHRVEQRLAQIYDPDRTEETSTPELIKGMVEGPMPAVDRMLGTTRKGHEIGRWIEQSGIKRATASGVLLIALGLGVLGSLAGAVLLHNRYLVPVLAAVGFALPFLVLKHRRTTRLRKFEEQFPEALDLIARSLKAGHAFSSGLKMVAEELAEPVGPEFRKTFDEQNFGLPLKDALNNLSVRIPLLDVRFFATAVMIQRDTGGNLAEILENLAHVVRERFKILRQVRVYTAHGRFTGYVLLALPVVLGIALTFINPDHMNLLFKERMGLTMLAGACVMQLIGYVWIRQVIKIEV
jgi:tight adherence protein B